jgi:hypothetical protein
MVMRLAAARGALRPLQQSAARLYLKHYRPARPLDMNEVVYYEAYRCLRSLVWAAENRILRSRGVTSRTSPWDAPGISAALASRFQEISGVPVTLPA